METNSALKSNSEHVNLFLKLQKKRSDLRRRLNASISNISQNYLDYVIDKDTYAKMMDHTYVIYDKEYKKLDEQYTLEVSELS